MNKFITNLILLLLLCGATSINAQIIVLSCKRELTREFLKDHTKFYEEMCSKYKDDSCQNLQRVKSEVRKCEQSGLKFSHKREFSFEKKALNNSNLTWVDMIHENCWGDNQNTRNGMTTTASTIFFADRETSFNVDRATLQGGWREDRSWKCDVKELIFKNKI